MYCAACALTLLLSSQPFDVYAGPAGPFRMQAAQIVGETAAESVQGAAGAQTAAGAVQSAGTVAEEEIDAFFNDSVFVGDSVMEGFRNYSLVRSDTWLGRLKFLAAVSFSTYSALRPVTAKSIQPVYAGQKRLLEDSIAMMGAKKVFMMFGPNDINITGIDQTAANYVELVKRIRFQSPDVEIYIMSMPYVLKGYHKHNLYNDNIRKYNETMKNLAAEQGWGFVDITTALSDENGDLVKAYSSDGDVHLRNAAYDVWSQVLRDYATEMLAKAAGAETAEPEAETEPVYGPFGLVKPADVD